MIERILVLVLRFWRLKSVALVGVFFAGTILWCWGPRPMGPTGAEWIILVGGILFGGVLYSGLLHTLLARIPWGSNSTLEITSGIPELDRILNEQRRDILSLSSEVDQTHVSKNDIVRRHAMLTDNLAAAVVIRNAEGSIVYCSPFTEVLTGYSRSEILGFRNDFFRSVIHEDDQERYERALQMIAIGEAYQYRVRLRHKGGIDLWIETRTVPIASRNSTDASLSISLDVTAAVHAQQQVEERNRDLRDFTYMISHDLKAPLATMKGMAQILSDEYAPQLNDDGQEIVAHLRDATVRLEKLTSSVLEYARLGAEESEITEVDLRSVLRDVVSDLRVQIQEVNAEVELPEECPLVAGDRLKLYRVFSNLIGNALKYRSPHRPPRVEITTKERLRRRQVAVTVRDNGRGIPAAKLESVFRPFTRIHPDVASGNGIGLASVRRIVELLGGSIHASSMEGEGTSFEILLPIPSSEV